MSLDKRHKPNRLINEKSPYLLQHAHNPVDWHPWGEEAFERARSENKPVLVSIGYSTCHWCHVMEKEVFEDARAAKVMNDCFVSIKVDREERPDLDHIYMTAAQMLTGGGGWPLNVFLTPDKKPFYAATYIPKETSQSSIGMDNVGMIDLAPRLLSIWRERQDEVVASALRVAETLSSLAFTAASDGWQGPEDGLEAIVSAFEGLKASFDGANGGFGRAPKFPSAHNLGFLLRYHKRTNNMDALTMVEETLTNMRLGGIFDQIGGGFHRYSVDSRWSLPHFEKMLYDQALIVMTCVEAYKVTGKAFYGEVARQTCDYALRGLASPDGAFFCGEDADSEGEEGKFYVWTEKELDLLLGKDDSRIAKLFYGTSGKGNFHDEATGLLIGQNVLTGKDPARAAKELGLSADEFNERLSVIKKKLLMEREKRPRPFRDEKILTDWNGLMIAALSMSGATLGEPSYCKAAARAADFMLSAMQKNGKWRLFHRIKDSEVLTNAFLDDYAFLTFGLLELHQATFDEKYLAVAIHIAETAIAEFSDAGQGGFFFTRENAPDVIVRQKQIHDGAMPSGNSVMALNLLRLGHMTGRRDFEETGLKAIGVLMNAVKEHPLAFTSLLSAIDFAIGPAFELVISGMIGEPDTEEMIKIVRGGFYPRGAVMLSTSRPDAKGATAYLCINKACEEPIQTSKELAERLKSV